MKTLTWNEFVENVQNWATERGIYEHSTPEAQLLKALSELGELADAVIKSDKDGIKDAIGDVAVCWVNHTTMNGGDPTHVHIGKSGFYSDKDIGLIALEIGDLLTGIYCDYEPDNIPRALRSIATRNEFDFLVCCTQAWNEIKNRKGTVSKGGAFVKDEP